MNRRRLTRALCSLLVVPLLFLLSPPRPHGHSDVSCPKRVDLFSRLHVHVSCDSPTFIRLALRPSTLFDHRQPRQSRPVVVAVAAVVALPLRAVTEVVDPGDVPMEALGEQLSGFRPGETLDEDEAAAAYGAYLAVNVAVLVMTIVLFVRLVWRRADDAPIVAALAVGLVANQVVKAFFWSPHTQMFNVLASLLVADVARRLVLRPPRSPWPLVGVGLLAGTLTLAYGVFAVLLPVAAAAHWWGWRRRPPAERPPRRRLARSLGGLAAGFVAPVAAWVVTVLLVTGEYYSGEAGQYRQFVWVLDAAERGVGPLVRQTGEYFGEFGRVSAIVLWFPLLLLGLALAAWWRSGRSLDADSRVTLLAAGMSFAGVGLFYAFLGYYQQRLSWALVPPVLVAAGVLGREARLSLAPVARTGLAAALAVASLASLAVLLVRPGPYG